MKNLFAILFALTALAHADTLTFVSTGSNLSGNVYTYPYYFSIDGSRTLTPMMCLSYDNEIVIGESWLVNVLPITTVPEIEAAWLFVDAQKNPGNDVSDNLAAWRLFSSDVPMDAGANAQLALAAAGYGSIDAADFVLYVPTAGFDTPGVPQTFVGHETPEPAYLWLMGMGFLILSRGGKLWTLKQK